MSMYMFRKHSRLNVEVRTWTFEPLNDVMVSVSEWVAASLP